MRYYKALENQSVAIGVYRIVPIRFEDRFKIKEWRNQQMYHLRQEKLLTNDDQERYFLTVIAQLFDEKYPGQLLFSYMKNDICIGYGGLVHIDWESANAELSFIMDTQLESENFKLHWTNFLQLIEIVAFKDLKFHKIFTYAYDLRPKIYEILESQNFKREARLKDHKKFQGKFIDVIIHSKLSI